MLINKAKQFILTTKNQNIHILQNNASGVQVVILNK